MLNKCGNCGQVVAATDGECWHCGEKLPPITTAAETMPVPELGMILRYAGLTAVSLLLLILATRAIGQAPLLRLGGNNAPLTGWQPVTDSQLQFTLNLPNSWQSIELITNPTAQATRPLPALAQFFEALVADSELLFLGMAEETAVSTPMVLIAQSQRLAQLTPQQYIAYAQTQLPPNVELLAAEVTTNDIGIVKGNLLFNLQQADVQWRCAHQFVPNNSQIYLITTCAEATLFTHHQAEFDTILLSFQPLDS